MIADFLHKCHVAYLEGKPLISDDEFDYLSNKYNYNEIGYTVPKSDKVTHLYKMYSLRKVFDDEERNPDTLFGNAEVICTPKLDGAAIELVYKEGYLVQASTRGDGIVGDNIFENILSLPSVPTRISLTKTIQVTGEVVAPKSIDNARNYASGALHLKDIEEFKSRDIIFIAYSMQIDNVIDSTYLEDMVFLKRNGFNTVTSRSWENYPQDGLVFRVDSNSLYHEYGFTAKHPKGAFAYKKRSDVEVKETKLLDVVWQVGKGRKVTPVAIFEDINIDGATINRATLHNAGFVEELDLTLGDTLLVTRSGGVIPKIIGKV